MRIAKIELNTMFYSPVAWLLLLVFAVQVGYSFVSVLGGILDSMDLGRETWSVSQQIFGKSMSSIMPGIQRYIYLYIPLITMGLMSREYASGSIKLLYSSPIKNSSIILGKFLSMVVYGGVLIGIIALFSVFTHIFTPHFDYKIVVVALLGLYLLILAYSAIGIFFSSLTKYQVVAAIGTLAAELAACLIQIRCAQAEFSVARDLFRCLPYMGIGVVIFAVVRGTAMLLASQPVIAVLLAEIGLGVLAGCGLTAAFWKLTGNPLAEEIVHGLHRKKI